MAFDAYLELDGIGESQDSKRATAIEIGSFMFGNSSMLTRNSRLKKMRGKVQSGSKTQEENEEQLGEFEDLFDTYQDKSEAKKSGRQKQDYRFQITKEIDAASPRLMQAFFSGSKRGNRPTEFNHYEKAIVTLRRLGGKADRPSTYLRFVFGQVEVVGYELETQGREAPSETVNFAFMTVEMEYTPQTTEGTKVKDRQQAQWSFATQDEEATTAS